MNAGLHDLVTAVQREADPVYAAADLDDATEVAQADNAADAREPIDGKLSVGAADAGLTRADAANAPDAQSLNANAAIAALGEAKAQAAEA